MRTAARSHTPRSRGELGRSPSGDQILGDGHVPVTQYVCPVAGQSLLANGGEPGEVVGVVDSPTVRGELGSQLVNVLGGVAVPVTKPLLFWP